MDQDNEFGKLLRAARETSGLTRPDLGTAVGLDPSYLYRLESGKRLPSREVVLNLANALKLDLETTNRWLNASRHAGVSLVNVARGGVTRRPVRVRGAVRPDAISKREMGPQELMIARAEWVDRIGFGEANVAQLLNLLEPLQDEERRKVTSGFSEAVSVVIEQLRTPVRAGVIPAAGLQHRVLASHYTQRLLLRVIDEAAGAGISEIVLVLAPGVMDALYEPLDDALRLASIPKIHLRCCAQSEALGLGDAVLQAEELVGREPFAVLLPDDIVRKRSGRSFASDLKRMIHAFGEDHGSSVVAVTEAPRQKFARCGVAQIDERENNHGIQRVLRLVERPGPSNAILQHASGLRAVVGRYILQPAIFEELRKLKKRRRPPIQLTDALENMRGAGRPVYALELKGRREDVGELLESTGELIRYDPS